MVVLLLSLMTLPTTHQPDIQTQFLDQTSITSFLFNYILEIVVTCEQLECSWNIIA
jgi:hypothetical protein